MTTTTIPAVEHGIDLRCSADHAFTVFTEGIATWWPLDLGAGSSPGSRDAWSR